MSYNPCATCNRHDWCDMDIEENASVCDSKDLYLVYYVGQCEMGSDGYSSMLKVCVASGNTEDEVIENYKENVKRLYGYDIHPTKTDSGQFVDYYTIKNGGYTNTVTMDIEDNNPYHFTVASDIMDYSPYASSISFKGKCVFMSYMSCLHIKFEFVCKHRIMMPFSKTIRRMMIHQYISNKSSPDTGHIIYGKFEGKYLDVIMKRAKSITDIIDYIKEYMLVDSKDMNCWFKDNVTIDKYYEVVNEI